MEQTEQTIEVLLAFCGGLTLVIGTIVAVWKFIRPLFTLNVQVQKHEREIGEIQIHEKKDLEAISALREMNRAQSAAMVTMLNHMIEGNNVAAMKGTREELMKLLADERRR